MINLIFLLLIFFLLTGVVQKKNTVEVNIPESSYGKKKKGKETLTIKKDGSIFWNNDEIIKRILKKFIK